MNIKYHLIILTVIFSAMSIPSHAGKIYRFIDKEGVSTLSKVLPPYAAQQGYDILDDKSYRLIERVLTLEESSKINAEERRLAEIKEKEDQIKLERLINDRSLLDRYPDDRVMINARDTDLAFLEKQILEVTAHKETSKQILRNLQQQAAEAELSGETVSSVLEERLSTAKEDIVNDQLHIERLEAEHTLTAARYDVDLVRLRELLHIDTSEAEEEEAIIEPSSGSE